MFILVSKLLLCIGTLHCVSEKNVTRFTFAITSADLADFGHNYRSVSLQHHSAYLLV